MTEKREWMRPSDIVVHHTSDPKEMLGKYLPKRVLRTWMEDFCDDDTGEVVSIERNEIVCESGVITQDKLQEITFVLQSGDIDGVDVCDVPMHYASAGRYAGPHYFMVEMPCVLETLRLAVAAQDIPQAIQIAIDYGCMYLNQQGDLYVNRVTPIKAEIIQDHDECIPEDERQPEEDAKEYFCVTVKMKWVKNNKLRETKDDFVLTANEVGQAKERMSRKLDILRTKHPEMFITDDGRQKIVTIHKAVPFSVDYVVPMEYSMLYKTK